ncbi:hypothetical protein PISMIDRAFT_676885 [Pisolithus microcarpus 441]|uniref:Uncharacterized protein n=1 Tax=Pisolithus microcarpus 441 TaxID=765257 RepID=A0A0D0A1F7_9AGAM|nr:hypothetical protein PISMIDRAFT_676885 [Pisolithus microcarpus 441]
MTDGVICIARGFGYMGYVVYDDSSTLIRFYNDVLLRKFSLRHYVARSFDTMKYLCWSFNL